MKSICGNNSYHHSNHRNKRCNKCYWREIIRKFKLSMTHAHVKNLNLNGHFKATGIDSKVQYSYWILGTNIKVTSKACLTSSRQTKALYSPNDQLH